MNLKVTSQRTVTLIANGDQREPANRTCWPEQQKVESALIRAIRIEGFEVVRAHPYDPEKGHGFIDGQKHGREVFTNVDPDSPLVVAFSAWQYSQHILAGLSTHRGPILTVANWSGTWPGLVGLLNMNGSLTKAGIAYSTLWSEDFTDEPFTRGLRQWLKTGAVEHDASHVRPARDVILSAEVGGLGRSVARRIKREKIIMGVFDEGCMGMYNAIIPDELLHEAGVFKERLSQSTLYYETTRISDAEAEVCLKWLKDRGMTFHFGTDDATELTEDQVIMQCKMYIAALRIADDFGCDLIGIQYQLGLKDLLPASDLAEGLLNNTERPPVRSRDGKRELYPGSALPHFNESDEGAGIDAIVTHLVWKELGYDPETTLHDVRWGEAVDGEFVWVFEISGAVPPQHLRGGYRGASSERQPPMYFQFGGGTIKGVSKPGEIVWSRVFVEDGRLKADVGRARVVELTPQETERRWHLTTPQWPIMSAVLYGVSRDQFMARHKANHIQVAYAPDGAGAGLALAAKVAAFEEMGIETFVCGSDAFIEAEHAIVLGSENQ